MIIKHEDLPIIREQFKNHKIVYCSGSFDLPHLGHILLLREYRLFGDMLVVNVGPDHDIALAKPGRPILPQTVRLKTVDSFKPVDFCFLGKKLLAGENSQAQAEEVFRLLRPDVYAVTEEAGDMDFRRRAAEKYNVNFQVIPRVFPIGYPDFSTTWIINRIKNSR